MNCIIIEDQAPAQRILENYISSIPDLEIIGVFRDVKSASGIISNQSKVDVIFIDIHLPGISGIEFVRRLPDKNPAIIFTTAFSDYAVESYELNAVDYLLKPFSRERFLKSIERLKEVLTEEKSTENQSILIKSGKETQRALTRNIFYIQSDMDYTEVNTKSGKILSNERLWKWEQALSTHNFIRVHKSFIIHLGHVKRCTRKEIEMVDGSVIPIGRAYKKQFLQKMENLNK